MPQPQPPLPFPLLLHSFQGTGNSGGLCFSLKLMAQLPLIACSSYFYHSLGFSPDFVSCRHFHTVGPKASRLLHSILGAIFSYALCLACFPDQAVHDWNTSFKALDLNPPLCVRTFLLNKLILCFLLKKKSSVSWKN